MASGSNLYDLIGISHDYHAAAAAVVGASALIAGGVYVRAKIGSEEGLQKHIIPQPKGSLLNASVEIVSAFRKLLKDMIGGNSEKFIPVIVGTFLVVLIGNLMGLFPGLISNTESFYNNFSMAIFIFLFYNFMGIKEHGILGYAKQFTGGLPPKGFNIFLTAFLTLVAGMIVVIELIGHGVRPFSLTLRLWGVVNGGHALMGTVDSLVPLILPMLVMALELLVSVIQAFVFAALSMVYIKLAVSHDH